MDPVRLLLISSTAVLSLMLLIEWNQYSDDYHKDQAERYAAEVLKAPSISPTYNSSNVNTPAAQNLSDIPSVVSAATPVPSSIDKTGLAYLETDTLNIAISTDGGDVVDASLPRFPVRLDTPDQPFLLLESSAFRTYVAQSGLIGPDGIDASGKRAQYLSLGTTVNDDNSQTLSLAWTGNRDDNLQVIKSFTAANDRYFIDVDYTITNSGPSPVSMT